MTPPSRANMEEMAFKAIMGSIGIGHFSCDCPTCSKRPKSTARSTVPKKSDPSKDAADVSAKSEPASGMCNHHHHSHHHNHGTDSRADPASKKAGSTSSLAAKAPQAPNSLQGRSDKINALLKADSLTPVFDVFNATPTTNKEKELVAQIQQITKDCQSYPDSKSKIMELCDQDGRELTSVSGLLAKFRHERNLLTTAMLKSNSEREKAFLCVRRVDDLMYMLQDVSKRPKDISSEKFMSRLGEIVMEVHEIARNPSSLYDELIDIRDEHLQLVDDHEDMHQKFADVNSCHDKLHANYEKLQNTHTKLLADHAEAKKKAALVNGLKNDVARLEKVIDRNRDENLEMKKEIEKLTSELAKVNALKHENAQLKKKVTTLSTQPTNEDSTQSPAPTSQLSATVSNAGKKKKGKKGTGIQESTVVETTKKESQADEDPSSTSSKNDGELADLKKSHELLSMELEVLRSSLTQLEMLRKKADAACDQAKEKLQVEAATSQNWQGISQGIAEEKTRLQKQLDHSKSYASKLQTTIGKLEHDLVQIRGELAEQSAAQSQLKAELETRSRTPAASTTSQPTSVVSQDTLRLLRKIKVETAQLARDFDDPMTYQGDFNAVFNMIQSHVRRVVYDVEKDIEEILSVKSEFGTPGPPGPPETVLPFSYGQFNQPRSTGYQPAKPDYSPHDSPQIPLSLTSAPLNFQPQRPSIPPGFEASAPSALMHSFGRSNEISMTTRMNAAPSSSSAGLHTSPSKMHNLQVPNHPGPIGSRTSSGSLNTGNIANRNTSTGMNMTPPPIGTPAPNVGSNNSTLGNGAVGVDWNMWSKSMK